MNKKKTREDMPSSLDVLRRKLDAMDQETESPPEPALASKDRISALREQLDELSKLSENDETIDELLSEVEDQAGAGIAAAVCDMLNRFAKVDIDMATAFVLARLPVSDSVVEAARNGVVPLALSPSQDGEFETSILGMFNAFLQWVSCKYGVAADLIRNEDGDFVRLRRFLIVNPRRITDEDPSPVEGDQADSGNDPEASD